ncbi:putative thymidylate synthase protein [Xanthomonas phage FoX4]|uniref:Putative thymidylate synthase protein n=1 Tax=Xanthomonas phage FoX4 TaxID=2723900 RepID=A0A858WJB0_9CAUD|nr:putative thymidylate synthase protein [Xanthomonas phage FoX4]QJI53019.1 putative thymidylate synthase protein [Xanthomonas phage FoX4]
MSRTSAKIIQDSRSVHGPRITTFEIVAPRMILAEINTHRALSRNYRSSRAVPVEKLIREVRTQPFVPLAFQRNKPGMQGGEVLSGEQHELAESIWLSAAVEAASHAEQLAAQGVHKQFANRVLEPYLYAYGVITATEWENFFLLRCHPDAQPEFQELAILMRTALAGSEPQQLREGDWHIPYIGSQELMQLGLERSLQISAARCAWVSYYVPEEAGSEAESKVANPEKRALSTFKKLSTAQPMHASPMEHQAVCTLLTSGMEANFNGFVQFRKYLEQDLPLDLLPSHPFPVDAQA